MAIDDAAKADGEGTLTATGSPEAPAPTNPTTRVGRYELREVLGAGGMGIVYRAFDPELGRDVAIKVLADAGSPSRTSRLLREAQVMARLRHPNIVPIFDVGPSEHSIFLAMPLMERGSLKRWLATERRPWREILDHFCQAGRGLAAAHAAGLVHRDFKPDNVLLGKDGEVQVADFGIARLAADSLTDAGSGSSAEAPGISLTGTGDVLGTPAYMSPEQLRGASCDERSDQFSFCVALWESLYGQRPFRSTTVGPPSLPDLIARIEAGPRGPDSSRGTPSWIRPLLARGLRVDPTARWSSMAELLEAIEKRARHRWLRVRWISLAALVVGALVLGLRPGLGPHSSGSTRTPQAFRLKRLAQRTNLRAAALSPDGKRFAMVTGNTLVWRGLEPEDEDHPLISRDVQGLGNWSPDNRHLIVSLGNEDGNEHESILDVETGERTRLWFPWRTAIFSSRTEVAATDVNLKHVLFYSLTEPAAAPVKCAVPGEYAWLSTMTRVTDGVVAIERLKGNKSGSAIIIDHTCRVRVQSAWPGRDVSCIANTDGGTLVAMLPGEGVTDIVEMSEDGREMSDRRVAGELHYLFGRRHGVDYVSTQTWETRIVRSTLSGSSRVEYSMPTYAIVAPALDGKKVAWIEYAGEHTARGPLRMSYGADLRVKSRPILDNVTAAAWSPDGSRIAALADNGTTVEAVVLDPTSGSVRRPALTGLERYSSPIWLDQHRVAGVDDEHHTVKWVDTQTGAQGTLIDREQGWVFSPVVSPKDGTMALLRNEATFGQSLWLVHPDGRLEHVNADFASSWVLPFWDQEGRLYVFDSVTGIVSWLALDAGKLTQVASIPPEEGFKAEQAPWFGKDEIFAAEIRSSTDVGALVPDQ